MSAQKYARYTIIAPSKIRPNSEYHLSLDISNITKPIDIDVEVSGKHSKNRVSNKITVQPSESSSNLLNLKIGEWQKGDYKLSVKGKSKELKISHETELDFERKYCSIFVQSDKAIYKPGQMVKFRAIVVNPSLIPNVSGTLDIYVKDSKDNLIKQWKRVSPKMGIFFDEIQLSDQPPLGNWSIKVKTNGQKCTKEFTVAEYVLPTFSVDVELPTYATYAQPEVVATVKANYTYGKPVKGECVLTVQTPESYFDDQMKFRTKVQIKDDGVVEIPVNLVKELELNEDYADQEIEFHATVTESLTGKKYSSFSVLKIYRKETKVELLKTSKTFKPGLKYTAFLKVAYQDDKPVKDNGTPVTLKYIFTNSGPDRTELTQVAVPVKGIVRVELNPPRNENPDDFMSLEWNAEYRGETYYLKSVENAKSPSNSFIQVLSKNDKISTLDDLFDAKFVKVGEKVTFQVNGVEPLTEVMYKVMSKGDIVLASSIKVKDPTTSIDITILITKQMAPKARLLVYYVRPENREIVADVLNFKVDGVFDGTPVKMTSNVNQTEPGGQVDITVQTQPSAYVGLLGIDQSILLLKSGNDLTREDICKDLELYDSGKSSAGESATAEEIFEDSGLVIFTNEQLYRFERPKIPVRRSRKMKLLQRSGSIDLVDNFCSSELQLERSKPVKLRQKFPETWIWENVTVGPDGLAKYSVKIPDTITSWIISALAMDSITGLGIAEQNLNIQVFQPFFAQLSLPYSIIRGESVEIQVLVFNYQKKPVQAVIVMVNAINEFEFVNDGKQIDRFKRGKIVSILPLDGTSVSFMIKPIQIGYIDIRVSAKCDNAGDALVKKLLVKAEGQTQYFNKAMFIKLDKKSNETVKRTFSIEIPQNAVPESSKVKVSGISDILGPTVNHLDDLLRIPYGCGEQNMINFVPNIVVLNYLTLVNRLTDEIKSKALTNISTGYQRELTYMRNDGSFSAFGNSDFAGSTWLTAFVVKSFIQARPYLDMDQDVISNAIDWLFCQQNRDGSFAENGEVHQKELQGGAAGKNGNSGNNSAAPLTAYVLIAILQEDKSNSNRNDNKSKIKLAENYIYSRLSHSTNSYEVSLIAHALHLANSKHKDTAYQKLMKLVKRTEDGLAYWTNKFENENKIVTQEKDETISKRQKIVPSYESIPNYVEVESTAYALLTMVTRSDSDNAIPALRWMISKQNSNGGFASTQDTVIGLQALGAIAEKIFTSTPQMSVSVKQCKNDAAKQQTQTQVLNFDAENALVLQQLELEPAAKCVELEASGYGTAIVQVSYQYNITGAALNPAFFLKPQVDKSSTENYMILNIQTYYMNGDSTNMTVMEVELPSGFTADLEALNAENKTNGFKRMETGNNHGKVFVYFDRVTKKEINLTVAAHRSHRVENIKPVPVTIYDYCDRNRMSRVFYEP